MKPTITTCSLPDSVSSTAAPEIGILPSTKDLFARSRASFRASMPAWAKSPSWRKSLMSSCKASDSSVFLKANRHGQPVAIRKTRRSKYPWCKHIKDCRMRFFTFLSILILGHSRCPEMLQQMFTTGTTVLLFAGRFMRPETVTQTCNRKLWPTTPTPFVRWILVCSCVFRSAHSCYCRIMISNMSQGHPHVRRAAVSMFRLFSWTTQIRKAVFEPWMAEKSTGCK